jgi:hypothetical protein
VNPILLLASLCLGGLVAAGLGVAAARMWEPAFWPVLCAVSLWWIYLTVRQRAAMAAATARRKGDFH